MSNDKTLNLDTHIAAGLPQYGQTAQDQRREPSDADRQAFEQAMRQPETDTPSNTDRTPLSSPFALFGAGLSVTADTQPAPGAGQPDGLGEQLAQMAQQLLVGDEHHGRRQVSIRLRDSVLPGVTVAVFEEAGSLVASFTCSSEPSRELLCACMNDLASGLSASLGRSAIVRVSTDDPEDPCLVEVLSGTP